MVDGPASAHEAQTKGSDDDSQFDAGAADGLRRTAGFQDQHILKDMLSLVYDAAIKAQFDQYIGAEPHERSDVRNGSRTRGRRTRAGSLDLEILRARNSNFRPTVMEQFRRTERALVSVIQEAFVTGISTRKMESVARADGCRAAGKSQISELCTELDGKAEEFRHRALTENTRISGRTCSTRRSGSTMPW